MGRRVGVRWRGARAEITLQTANGRGDQYVVLRRDRINDAAISYFAFRYCHWLAAELGDVRGWPLVLVERRGEWGGHRWVPIHTAVHTPRGLLLDIRGEHTPHQLVEHYTRPTRQVRLRLVTAAQLGDRLASAAIMPSAEVGPGWWRHDAVDRPHRIVRHFASALLHAHGFADRPARRWSA